MGLEAVVLNQIQSLRNAEIQSYRLVRRLWTVIIAACKPNDTLILPRHIFNIDMQLLSVIPLRLLSSWQVACSGQPLLTNSPPLMLSRL